MSEKKKLMLISPMLHQGGFERVCITTARLLEPYFEITIVIFDSADIAYNVDGLHIVDLKLGVQRGRIRKVFNILRRSHRLRQLKKEMKPGIAYSFGSTANIANAFSKTKETKVWLGLRSYADMEDHLKLKVFMQLGDLMVCCSKQIEDGLKIKYGFNKTTVLYNPFDVNTIKAEAFSKEPELPWKEDGEEKNFRYLISMGRDDELKGFWHMLKIFKKIHEQMPDVRLILLGDGSFEEYKKLAADLGIREAVFFAGMQKEPYKYLKKAEIYLLTSVIEGFPNALVEGMALGLAAVSTDCRTGPAEILLDEEAASHTEALSRREDRCRTESRANKISDVIYGEYGILVPAMDRDKNLDADDISPEEKNMADVIMGLMQDEKMLKRYQEAACRRAQIFTYEHYVEQFLKLAEGL